MFDFFRKKSKRASKALILNPNSKTTLGGINYPLVKRALKDEDLSAFISIFDYLCSTDTQVSSEIYKRKSALSALPLVCTSEDKNQEQFLASLMGKHSFRRFLFDCSSSIAYGFSAFILGWNKDGDFVYPRPLLIPHSYIQEEKGDLFILNSGEKIYLKDRSDVWVIYHPTDSGELLKSSLMHKICVIASLKASVISKNMIFFDSLSIPPLIIKSEAMNNEESAKEILESALELRSNGVALFAQNDVVDLLNGNVDKGSFLEFIRYCDECISKVITGQVLAGNSVGNGTQALGKVHEQIRRQIQEHDAMLLGESVFALMELTLSLNFSSVANFSFGFDINTEVDEKTQSEVYLNLTSMGYEIPIEHLERTFKIKGLKKSIPASSLNRLSPSNLETNKRKLPIPLDKLKLPTPQVLASLITESESLEEVYEKILASYKGEALEELEEELMRYLATAQIKGALNEA